MQKFHHKCNFIRWDTYYYTYKLQSTVKRKVNEEFAALLCTLSLNKTNSVFFLPYESFVYYIYFRTETIVFI